MYNPQTVLLALRCTLRLQDKRGKLKAPIKEILWIFVDQPN
jgi:hypothetical protein